MSCGTRSRSDGFPIFRLDADSATLDQRAGILQRFEAADSAVLVGTQMVAKGHDFPDVGSLGVVLDADPDFAVPRFPRRGAGRAISRS